MAKKGQRASYYGRSTKQKRLGINLDPILKRLSAGVEALQGQLRDFADDPKTIKAIKRSIATLEAARRKAHSICPDEEFWFGVPTRGDRRRKG